MNSIVNESTTQRQGGEGSPTNPAAPSDVVAALRRHGWVRIMQEAADLIEQQAARIAELEAAFEQVNRNRESVDALKNQLATLRQKIEDAPVVAWLLNGEAYPVKQCSIVTDEEFPNQVPLISKEDLQK